jgi:uncharacterized membrane protein YidH (DUF202 family)
VTPARIAIAGVGLFVALVALQHPLRADLPPADHFVSEYARGSTAAVQVAAFVLWAAGIAACAVLAARARPAGRPIARGLAVLGFAVAAAGALLAAVFATQTIAGELPPGEERTTEGRLHDLGSLLIFAGLLLAALAALRIVRRRRFRVTVALLALALLAVVPVLVALGLDAPGIGQRGFILVGCALLWRFAAEAAATRPRPPAPGGAAAPPASRGRAAVRPR